MQGHRARKRFGQNFLTDDSIIAAIVSAISAKPGDWLVEIGPGLGALTRQLIEAGAALKAIELDRDLVPKLERAFGEYDNFSLINADSLNVDYRLISDQFANGEKLRIVGNLPYNISTPLMFKLLESSDRIVDMHFMLQREVVNRLSAEPGTSAWGRLGIMMQYFCEVEPLIHVPPTAFSPPPKVHSSVVRLTPKPASKLTANNVQWLESILRNAFAKRRKTLRNALRGIITEEQLENAGISAGLRPENLTLQQYVELSNATQNSADNALHI